MVSQVRNSRLRGSDGRGTRGFTLVELLVSIGLMALLATLSTTGYYAASRGMADRGAVTDVRSVIRSAMQRALVDQVPTAVLFYNQRLRAGEDDETEVVFGTAVAVRTAGRISRVINGELLCDEFADLQQTYSTNRTTSSSSADAGMRLYRMASVNQGYNDSRTLVESSVSRTSDLTDSLVATVSNLTDIAYWGFKVHARNSGPAASAWSMGDAYGMEIASVQLPHGYIFGGSKPPNSSYDPVAASGMECLVFTPDVDPAATFSPGVEIYAMRPSGLVKVNTINKVEED